MIGPTYEPVRVTELAELHEISVAVGPDVTDEECREIWSICGDRAQDWATTNDIEIEIEYFARQTRDEDAENCVGVSWKVVVGRGSSATPGSGYHETMEGQRWTWNERWQFWARWFRAMHRASPPVAQQPARGGSVTPFPGVTTGQSVPAYLDNRHTNAYIESQGMTSGQRFLSDHGFEMYAQANQSGHPTVSAEHWPPQGVVYPYGDHIPKIEPVVPVTDDTPDTETMERWRREGSLPCDLKITPAPPPKRPPTQIDYL